MERHKQVLIDQNTREKGFDKDGFTLVEVLICFVISMIAFASAALVLQHGGSIVAINKEKLCAMNALRQELEDLRNTNFNTVSGLNNQNFTNTQMDQLIDPVGTIAISNGSGNDIKEVCLSITWEARNGRSFSDSVTTYITRRGVNGA